MGKKEIRQRLQMLQRTMRGLGIDYYLVPTADFHNSEYVSGYFKAREFLSGFTGSNGTLLVSLEEAGLWTDGRYFVQAERELEDTGIRLFKMQEEGVPDIITYLQDNMWEGQCLGFDGRVVDADFGVRLEEALSEKAIRFACESDVVGSIWQDRPAFPCSRAEIVPASCCGESVGEKLARIREKMKEEKASCFFISRLDDLMWLFNLRGSDVEYNPVLMSYGLVTGREAYLFLQAGALQREAIESMREADVQIRDYWSILPFLQSYFQPGGYDRGTLLYDRRNISYAVYQIFRKYGRCRERMNPTEACKAVKTEKELEFIRAIYLKDSVAVTKFIYWLKHAVKAQPMPQAAQEAQPIPQQAAQEAQSIPQTAQAAQPIPQQTVQSQPIPQQAALQQEAQPQQPFAPLTEYGAALYLDNLRRTIPEFLDLSFPTISAYMENAAMMHYEAGAEGSARITDRGMLLVDSGGQYLGGTTDVTRTIVLGEISDEVKEHFTAVAVGMLRLAQARFLYGCTGRNLDILARGPLWDRGMDYKCGTGHGVGYMLNVHEGPHSIRWKYIKDVPETPLEPGMIVTDEPGVYRQGMYGIRTENVLEVKRAEKTGDGQFMKFEHLTYVPIDLEAIVPEQMPEKERKALNEYHRAVYDKISPYLTADEQAWLAQATRGI